MFLPNARYADAIAARKKETTPASNCLVTVFKMAHAQKNTEKQRMVTPKVLVVSWRADTVKGMLRTKERDDGVSECSQRKNTSHRSTIDLLLEETINVTILPLGGTGWLCWALWCDEEVRCRRAASIFVTRAPCARGQRTFLPGTLATSRFRGLFSNEDFYLSKNDKLYISILFLTCTWTRHY